jgi:DNA-binding NarL/FixJ family response regulator
LLIEARAIGERLGAKPMLERVTTLEARLFVAPRPRYPAGLSAREVEVLALLVEGLSNREIADRLSVSHRTVMNHVSSILGKLGVTSRTAAATVALREGLIPPR